LPGPSAPAKWTNKKRLQAAAVLTASFLLIVGMERVDMDAVDQHGGIM